MFEDILSVLNASLEGARIVTLVKEPKESARPGTLSTILARDDRDDVAPRRPTKDMLEFCAKAVVARRASGRSLVYILRLLAELQFMRRKELGSRNVDARGSCTKPQDGGLRTLHGALP